MALEVYHLSNGNEDVGGDRKLILSLNARTKEEEALKEYNDVQMLADGLHPYGVFSIELFKSANASDYQPFLRVIEEWSDKKLCSVWLSDTLPADLNLPMDTKTPDCKLVQMFVLCEDEPSLLLSVYQTDADPQAREKEIMEFTAKTARQLTFFLHRYCYCDFLILPCTISQSSFTVEGIAKEVKEQQDFSRSYYFGPKQLTTDDYEKLRKAATVLSSTSYVPCFLSKTEDSEHFDSVSETQTEDWLLLLDSDWRKLLSLLVETFSRGKDSLYLTYTKRSKDKLTAAAIEAARRLSFQNEVEIVTNDSTILSCVQKLVDQTKREFKGSVRLKLKLRDVQLTSKPSVPFAHHLEPSTESAATPSEKGPAEECTAEEAKNLPKSWPPAQPADHNPSEVKVKKSTEAPEDVKLMYRQMAEGKREDVYTMKRDPRGRFLMYSNRKFTDDLLPPLPLEPDEKACVALFDGMGFRSTCKENTEKQEMLDDLKEEVKEGHKYDCFVVAVTSHGSKDVIYSHDGQEVLIDDLKKIVDEAEGLHGKPKLFFIDACQGEEQNIRDKGLGAGPKYADTYTAVATVPNYKARALEGFGSYFLQAVAYVFSRYACTDEINQMLTKVNHLVSLSNRQMPVYSSSLRAQLYFFPGLHE